MKNGCNAHASAIISGRLRAADIKGGTDRKFGKRGVVIDRSLRAAGIGQYVEIIDRHRAAGTIAQGDGGRIHIKLNRFEGERLGDNAFPACDGRTTDCHTTASRGIVGSDGNASCAAACNNLAKDKGLAAHNILGVRFSCKNTECRRQRQGDKQGFVSVFKSVDSVHRAEYGVFRVCGASVMWGFLRFLKRFVGDEN